MKAGPIPVPEALRYAIALAELLREMHAHGRTYGVLQPAGIGIVEEKVGLVPVPPAPLTPYFSPEQVAGHDLDPRSDIFSLGAVLYEMLSGRPAFRAPTKPALRLEIMERHPAPLEHVCPGLWRVTQRCLEKKPERRVQRMQILLAELKLQEILARGPSPDDGKGPLHGKGGRAAHSSPTALVARGGASPTSIEHALPKRDVGCPMCGSREVYESKAQSSLEVALVRLRVGIHRCHHCYHRFVRWAGVSMRMSGNSKPWTPPAPKAVSTHGNGND